jgi:hypothetical protein
VLRRLDASGRRQSIVILSYHLAADPMLINFALACLRLGHKVTVMTAKYPGKAASSLTVEVLPLNALLGSERLAQLAWLPAVCAYLHLVGRRFDFAVHTSGSLPGVSVKAIADEAVLCIPAEPRSEKGFLKVIFDHLVPVWPLKRCDRTLRKAAWPFWSAVLVEEGAKCDFDDSSARVHRIAAPVLGPNVVEEPEAEVTLEALGISCPGEHFLVAHVNSEAEGRFLLDSLIACQRIRERTSSTPWLILVSSQPLQLDWGDLPVLPVVRESSPVLLHLTKRAAAYVHAEGASRAALQDALSHKRPVIAYGDADADLLLGPHAIVVERDAAAVAGAFQDIAVLAETDKFMLASLGDAAKQRVYHLSRVASFDRSVSESLNTVAAMVQVQKPPAAFWQSRGGPSELNPSRKSPTAARSRNSADIAGGA